MFEEVVGNNGTKFIIAAAAVALGLLLMVVVFWMMRNRASSPFLRGGKNRQPRLAVLDAAAVDTRRRLVLVRRDDVEHLIMIGGPTDIVIESRIIGARPGVDLPPSGTTPLPSPAAKPALANTAPGQIGLQPASSSPVQMAPARSEASHPARIAPDRRPAAPVEDIRAETRPEAKAIARPAPVPPPAAPQPAAPQPAVPQPLAPATSAPKPSQPPVSAMGQALYGDDSDAPPRAPPAPARAAPQPVAPVRPLSVAPPQAPEDILEAARARVLTQQAAPAAAARPQPASAATPTAEEKPNEARDFERLLDAQISGDLGRLAAVAPTPARAPAIEPPRARKEPTLEEEMNRMLSEMGNERKS